MARISKKISESLSEYLILTDWIETRPEEVSLHANLGDIKLEYPFMTARMQCVVGPEMAISAGRNGILTIIPRSLRDEDRQAIIDANNKSRLRKGDIEFQENPEYVKPKATLEEVIKLVNKTGHSVIPVMDRKSKLYGIYIHNPDNLPIVPPSTPITEVMLPLESIPYLENNEDKKYIKQLLSREKKKFLPIVNEHKILEKIAFLQKFDTNYIGIVIPSKKGWKEELEKWAPQVDTLCIDSSNACFKDAITILKYAKKKFPNKPFGIGNIIQSRDFMTFAEAGADYIIAGMGVGSICKTGAERGNGRGQFTVASELAETRDKFAKKRYVPLVIDGGIGNVKDLTIALAFGDFVMMGNYFNRFYEAAAQKFDNKEPPQPTSEESQMYSVESWGEGHPRARLVAMYGMNFRQALSEVSSKDVSKVLERYGHSKLSSATVEGIVGLVNYRGRLKPCVEEDARYIRTTISNAGACDLASFRKKAILEKASAQTLKDMLPHGIKVTEQ
jgi:IMP dehydrogenase